MNPVVLLVDDEERLLRGLERCLEELDYDLLQASNGKEALKIVGNQKVDLIVTDLLMPDMGGLELMQQLTSWQVQIPIIAMSGGDLKDNIFDAGSLLQNAERYGAFEVIEKPFPAEKLVEIIEQLLSQQKEQD